MFPDHSPVWSLKFQKTIYPLNRRAYRIYSLVPEALLLLVMQDMNPDGRLDDYNLNDAMDTLLDSYQYGLMQFDDGEDTELEESFLKLSEQNMKQIDEATAAYTGVRIVSLLIHSTYAYLKLTDIFVAIDVGIEGKGESTVCPQTCRTGGFSSTAIQSTKCLSKA